MLLESQELFLNGSPICRGIAIGRPFFLRNPEYTPLDVEIDSSEIEAEVHRYNLAVASSCKEIRHLQQRLQQELAFDGIAVLDAHLQMMQDPLLQGRVEEEIRHTRKNAEFVFYHIINEYKKKFEALDDPFFRERFKDFHCLCRRVIGYLRNDGFSYHLDVPQDAIILAQDLTTLDTAKANALSVGAFITTNGGATTHAAIVAKAKGIPFVSSININALEAHINSWMIVDGRTGEIIVNPLPETLEKYQQLRERLNCHLQKMKDKSQLIAETFDGYQIRLSANVETIQEIDILHQYGGSGIGLLRTESVFLSHKTSPSEEEQLNIYRAFVEKMDGLPIVIRTFDLGGDKKIQGQEIVHENNPFLGCRAIRFSLREKGFFKTQLRAILRAGSYGHVKILFPMISTLSELREAKEILSETQKELLEEGHSIADHIPIGCMIEVPSAAMIVDLLAQECDFLSIGTNDLVQYVLAVDRNNHALSDLYTPTHPSVIRLLKLIVSEANYRGIPVAVCGEVAADPRFTPLLLGLGVQELSVAPRYLPVVKNAIRNTSIITASKLADLIMTLSSAEEVEKILTQEYCRNVPEDCFYNLKRS